MSTLELALESEEQLAAGARSQAYALLAEAFAFPVPGVANRLHSGEWLNEFADNMAFLPFVLELTAEDRRTLAEAPGREALEHDYIRLFEVGAGRPFCPLYEGAHRGGRMKIMEELVRYLEHFGLKPTPGDQPDHLCAELQFMHYLAFKRAAITDVGPAAASLDAAQRDYLYRHLCKWLPSFGARLADAPQPSAFYSALAAVARAFCGADLAWINECREIPDPQIGPLPD
jgi:DMSO reductase family type II enzyme chaperone